MLHDRLLTAGEVNPAAVFAPEMTAPAPVTPPAEPARSADPAAPTDAAAETVPAPDPAPDEDGVLRLLKGKLVSRKAQKREIAEIACWGAARAGRRGATLRHGTPV